MSLDTAEIQQLPLFAALSSKQIELLHQHSKSIALQKGQILFRMGEPSNFFFYLQLGKIKLARSSPQGLEKVLAIIDSGQLFAEAVMFIEGSRFPATAEALETSEVTAFDSQVFTGFLRNSPELSMVMLGNLSKTLHQKVIEIDSLTMRNANYRVLHFIDSLIPSNSKNSVDVTLPGPKNTVASRLSIAPETLSRSLQILKEQKVIHIQGNSRTITIPDVKMFKQFLARQ